MAAMTVSLYGTIVSYVIRLAPTSWLRFLLAVVSPWPIRTPLGTRKSVAVSRLI